MKNTKNFIRAVFALACIAVSFSLNSCQKDAVSNPAAAADNSAIAARGGVVVRPFSDFMNSQARDFFAWATAVTAPGGQRGADVDYMGTIALSLADSGGAVINTEITGTLSEMQMPDGRAKVTVTMKTANALSCGYQWNSWPVIDFGYSIDQLAADHTLTPTVGWAHFKLVFYNSAMGAPIPNVAFDVPFEDFIEFNFHSEATGPLHASSGYAEGTLATMKVDMVGVYRNKNHYIPSGTTADGFPVEKITYTLQ